jgi:hypothetical protein
MSEIVYILINEAMPGLVKIGRTNGDSVQARMKQLDTTGLPLPFECFYASEVSDATKVERAIHTAFGDQRVRTNREFFRLSPDKPKAIFELLEIRNVTPNVDVVGEPGDQEALDQAKTRAPNFRFSMIGLKPGAELQSVFDDAVSCTVKDDRRVIFRGEEDSISGSALKIAREKGYGWNQIAGPNYWKYNGRTLSEIRDDPLGNGEAGNSDDS